MITPTKTVCYAKGLLQEGLSTVVREYESRYGSMVEVTKPGSGVAEHWLARDLKRIVVREEIL